LGAARSIWQTIGRGAFVIAAFGSLAVSGCATPPPADDKAALAAYQEANDPIEPFNRFVFELNRGLDRIIIRPVAEVYREVLPRPVRDSVRNVFNNLRSPVIFANDLLQGETERAGDTFGRFVTNTFVGLGGIFDVADGEYAGDVKQTIPYHNEDFGQTLAVWGADEGPYLVLPLFGPSPLRDTAGMVGDAVLDPFTWLVANEHALGVSVTRFAVRGIDTRSRNIETIDEIERSSIDFYAAVRSLYRQRRAAEIANGRGGDEDGGLPDINLSIHDDKANERVSQLRK
jgi:phospholipid-binding lipoprotein MlaA